MTLRIESTSPDEEVSFKGTYLVDTAGVQEIEAQTPFDVEGQSDTAFARLEKVAGEAQLLVELVRLGPDGHRSVASATGPRIEVRMTTPRSGSGP